MANKLKEVRALREQAYNQILETHDVALSARDDPSLRRLFLCRFNRIGDIAEQFQKHHDHVVSAVSISSDPDMSAENNARKEFERLYFDIEEVHADLFPPTSLSIPSPVSIQEPTINIRLPKVALKTFNGDFSQWNPFIQTFNASIHLNRNIALVDKFTYLLGVLTGEPLNLIKSLTLTAENYPIAYKALVDRYDDKRELASQFYHSIINLPKLTNESHKSLRLVLDRFRENRSALIALQIDAHLEDFLWFNMLFDKLDNETKRAFEAEYRSLRNAFPSREQLESFIESQCRILGSIGHKDQPKASNPVNAKNRFVPKSPMRTSLVSTSTSEDRKCPVCSAPHFLYSCPTFRQKTPTSRFDLAKQHRVCFNCLRPAHSVASCNSTQSCRECNAKHHTLLHFQPRGSPPVENELQAASDANAAPQSLLSSTPQTSQVLLATACFRLRDKNNELHAVRALIDPGSQVSYIIASCAQKLGLPKRRINTPITGLGEISMSAFQCTLATACPTTSSQPELSLELFVLPRICGNLPTTTLNPATCRLHQNLCLADPLWYQSRPVELLLGADIYPSIVRNDTNTSTKPNSPLTVNTIFGLTLLGPITSDAVSSVQTLLSSVPPVLDQTLRSFWEVEEIPSNSNKSPEDERTETLFCQSLFRESSGRFGVLLPFKTDTPRFRGSKEIADHRFEALERRLLKQPELKDLYVDFMKDYLDAGHMSLVKPGIVERSDDYYIPYHAVVKYDNGVPKIRVVFDASAKDYNHLSLNDTLLPGPKLQNDILELLLKFRTEAVVFTCDVRQMYRQILVAPEHRRFQYIRWRFSPNSPIQTLRLNTVTYGVSSAPYLAIRTLLELATIGQEQYPLAAKAIRFSLYVDDLICTAPSVSHAIELQRQLVGLFSIGCFELRKWSSNCPNLLHDVPIDHRQLQDLAFDSSDASLKILGLRWQADSDTFRFDVKPNHNRCTKRSLLSEVARIYDPLGFLCPVTFFTKRLIQHLWVLGLDWDSQPPSKVSSQWCRFRSELAALSSLQIPRWVLESPSSPCELHGFCDASEVGYAAVIYVRLTHENNIGSTRFLIAKSKVSPLKKLSVPRLELCAAVLLSKLLAYVIPILQPVSQIHQIHAWTDSTIVLNWIRSLPHRWKTFVANRVSYIQDRVPPECWRHVPSSDNPADVASRGLFPSEFVSLSQWWAGPSFLTLPKDCWPTELKTSPTFEGDPEVKVITLVTQVSSSIINSFLTRCSSLRRIQGIIAYIFRFRTRSLQTTPFAQHASLTLTREELHVALMRVVKFIQHEVFTNEITELKLRKPLPKWLAKLSPFLDADDILRVGGRLRNSDLSFASKHPALLPSSHKLTELIIRQTHRDFFHTGVNATLFLIQQNFWIISSKRAIRLVLSRCNRCFRTRPSPLCPPMGDLPASRVTQAKPFSCVGCDYAGPFPITMGRVRGAKSSKAYLCLFVCFATKALHLEVASSLSTDTFLAALRRFVARRGRCSKIFSDCGTNFVGASRELNKAMQKAVEAENISWSFNPPSAPHFGGLWESGVKSVKTHLNRVVGDQILTFEEFSTLFAQIEALLNSRPLCSLSTDPNDFSSLTPGHFLTLEPLTAPPDPDLSHLPINRLSRWQLIQQMQQSFWSRWRDEYLHGLHQKSKWASKHSFENTDIGTLVLIKDELAPPLKWRIGRITELFPGRDGIARVANVRTSQGTIKRPMVKLCALPAQ